MACQPDICVWIHVCHIRVKVDGSPVISIFVVHGLNDASQICCKSRLLAVADLSPEVRASLPTATAEEQIIVDLIVCGCASTIEQGRASSFQGYDDSTVRFICIYVAPQSVRLPPKA